MKYLLDSNVFIEAKNRYYSFDIAQGFWEWLGIFTEEQSILTIREVRDEIVGYDDELKDWIMEFPLNCFVEANTEIQHNMREITNYVMNDQTFTPENKNSFLAKADPWLIATAMAHDCVIVTHENKVGFGARKVKIPNISEIFGVECTTVFDLMRIKKVNLRI